MKISDLLCSPLEAHQPAPVSFQPRGEEENNGRAKFNKTIQLRAVKKSAQFAVLPDKRRKRHYLSVAQKQRRRDYEAYESRVFNLTLDINQLKQEVKRLQECRDLYTTRLLLNRQRWENDVLGIVEALICGARKNLNGNVVRPQVCNLARTITTEPSSQTAVVACGSVHEFNMHLEKARFLCVISSMKVVFIGDDEESEVAGGNGECVVEVIANITFPFSRHLLTAVFPHAVGDEFLIARLVGVTITCPVRMFLHFNAQRELGRQVGQVEMLPALQQARPNEIAALASDEM